DRIGAVAVVDVRVGIYDRAVAVDDIGGRDGQHPLMRCTILGRNVVAELLVGALQFRRELIDKAKGASDVLPDIAQDLKGEPILVDSVSSGFSGLIATSVAPAALISGRIA